MRFEGFERGGSARARGAFGSRAQSRCRCPRRVTSRSIAREESTGGASGERDNGGAASTSLSDFDLVGRSHEEGHSIGTLSPISFAFLGDVVWELHARTKHLLPPSRVTSYRKQTEKSVMAEHQAACLDKLTGEGVLTEDELVVVKRGRNSNTPSVPKRLRSDPESKTVYAKATALECLVGYLYLTDPSRLAEVMRMLGMRTEEKIRIRQS